MKDITKYYVILTVCFRSEYCVCKNEVEEAFSLYKIVPDVLHIPPSNKLHIYYPESNQTINFGTFVTPTSIQQRPEIYYTAERDAYYTLIMIDPDAPQRHYPIFREWVYWLVVNIQGMDFNYGQILADYSNPQPPLSGGLHRYIFLVYKQPRKIEFFDDLNRFGRSRFSTKEFAEKYNLGTPIAGNFFLSQYEGSEQVTKYILVLS